MKAAPGHARRVAMWGAAVLLALSVPFAMGTKLGLSLRGRGKAASAPPEPAWKWGSEGRVDVCLFTRSPRKPEWLEGRVALTIDGVLAGFGRTAQGSPPPTLAGTVVACEPGPDGQVDLDGYFDVEDAKHEVWRVLYGLSGATAPGLATRTGAPVTLRFDAHWGFSRAAGFMLLDGAGPVIAVERGTFGRGLAPEDLRPFTVSPGETIGRRTDYCGDELAHALQITGDEQVRALPGRERDVSFHGVAYRFWNAEATTWKNGRCTDLLDEICWALWRR
jgi:hypothetical protein